MASYTHESMHKASFCHHVRTKTNQTDKKLRYWQWHDAAFLSLFLPFTGRELREQNVPSLQLSLSLSLSLSLIFCSRMSKERQEQKKSLQEHPRMQMDLYPTLLSDSVETNRPKKSDEKNS
jgi:hypothetical protein